MNTLADAWHGGGPWFLFFPFVWAIAVAGAVLLLRRTGLRGRGHGPWQLRAGGGEPSPMTVLGRRFASGEIDEEEYWRRLSVLEEHFAGGKGGAR